MKQLERVEKYVINLKRKAENLENIQQVMKRFSHESHTATIIKERRTKDKELFEAQSMDTSTRFPEFERSIVKNGGIQ